MALVEHIELAVEVGDTVVVEIGARESPVGLRGVKSPVHRSLTPSARFDIRDVSERLKVRHTRCVFF